MKKNNSALPNIMPMLSDDESIPEAEDYSFLVGGDPQFFYVSDVRSFDAENYRGFDDVPRAVNMLGSDFAVIVGDIIFDYIDTKSKSGSIEKYKQLLHESWGKSYQIMASLPCPIYQIPGNHDCWGEEAFEIYRKLFGQETFSFLHKGDLFIGLNSEIPEENGNLGAAQLKWLEDVLTKYRDARNKFIFLHRNGYCCPWWMENVHPTLAKYGVNFVFMGHAHIYQQEKFADGVSYITTGGLCRQPDDTKGNRSPGSFRHVCSVSMRDGKASAVVVPLNCLLPIDSYNPEFNEKYLELVDYFAGGARFLFERDGDMLTSSLTVKNPFDFSIELLIEPNTSPTPAPHCAYFELGPGGSQKFKFNFADVKKNQLPEGSLKVVVRNCLNDLTILKRDFRFIPAIKPVEEWLVIGPFELGFVERAGEEHDFRPNNWFVQNKDTEFFKQHPIEEKLDFAEVHDGKYGPVKWQRRAITQQNPILGDFHLDFEDLWGSQMSAYAYAFTYIIAQDDCEAVVHLGSDDGFACFVNGEEAARHHTQRGCAPDQDIFPIKLKKGVNEFLVKVETRLFSFGLVVGIEDPENKLEFTLQK